jgi:hypothetical protein
MRYGVLLAVVVLAFAGCTGSVTDQPTATPSAESSGDGSPTARATDAAAVVGSSAFSDETAGERAIRAEKARVRNATAAWPNRTDLSFGILRPAEYEVQARNASGLVVHVTVGYSTSFDCGLSVDGAATETRYVVTPERTRLVAVEQDVPDSPGYCE